MLRKLLAASEIFRKRYGQVRGFVFWVDMLRGKLYRRGQILLVRVPGIRHRYRFAHTSDIEALCQIFCHAELDVALSHPVRYAIDAGANIGLTSVFLANRYPDARIDALEIYASNLMLLRANVAFYPKVRVHAKGLLGRSAKLKILNPDAEPWAFRVAEIAPNESGGIGAVSVTELAEAAGCKHIDLLKIDIEGAEVEVLSSSDPWIGRVSTMFIELHDRIRPGCSAALAVAIRDRPSSRRLSGEYHVITFENLAD
ncbi:MAG: FkbM family methyltransferase [Gammaproteobacteria bacterium]|nr:FkbM family methyltransferase [Gammaproteobacteria bacterium]